MVDNYYTGGGTPQENSSAKLFLATFLGGFPAGTEFVDITDGGYITKGDPYFKFCDVGGDQVLEIGIWNDYRLKISNASGIQAWDEGSSQWIDLIQGATGVSSHASTHENGGADEIDVSGLSGVLNDAQVPQTHDNTKHSSSYITELSEDSTPQLGGDLDLNGNNIDFPTTPNISDCIDDDTMATATATVISTSESTKAYIDNKTLFNRIHLKKSAGSGENVDEGVGNEIEIDWDVQTHIDTDDYTHSTVTNNHQITVDNAGLYQIMANLTYETTIGSARDTPIAYIKLNGTAIESTSSFSYDRGTTYGTYSNVQISTILELSANDIISVGTYAVNEDGVLSISDEYCEIIIVRLR